MKKKNRRFLKNLVSTFLVFSVIFTFSLSDFAMIPSVNFPPRVGDVEAAVPSGVIVAWPSTNGSIPSGWSRVTALDGKFTRGVPNASTNPGTTGGAATHQHTTSNHDHTISHTHADTTTGAASGTITVASTGTPDAAVDAHTHATGVVAATTDNSGVAAPSSGATTNDPANLSVIWIQSDGTPTGIPAGALSMFNSASLPTNWTIYANSQDRFLKGAATSGDGGTTAGANTHNHTGEGSHTHTSDHTHPNGTTGNAPNLANSQAAGTLAATDTHNHTYTVASGNFGTSDAATLNTSTDNHEPPWQKVAVIENGTGGADLPTGTIAVWRGTLANIPENWVLADGNNSTPNLLGDFAKGVANTSEIGNTGGATTHSHTGVNHTHTWASTAHTHTINTNATTSLVGVTGTNVTRSSASHTHTGASGAASAITPGNAAPNLSSETSLPPYEEVAYIMYAPPTSSVYTQNHYYWYVNSGSENVTEKWGVPDLTEDGAITVIPSGNDPPGTSQELRLRVNVTVDTAAISAGTKYFKLQHRTGTDSDCSAGSWTDVGTGVWVYATSAVADDEALTAAKLTGTDRLETYSKVKPANTPVGTTALGEDIEFDFHIVGSTAVSASRYLFRVVESTSDGTGTTALNSYSANCPVLTTEPGTDNLLRHGNVFSEGSEKGLFWAN